jgi:YVTN family beta-propeller protein
MCLSLTMSSNRDSIIGGSIVNRLSGVRDAVARWAVSLRPPGSGARGHGPGKRAFAATGAAAALLVGSLGIAVSAGVADGSDVITAAIHVGTDPDGVAVNPDGIDAYVINGVDSTISIIDLATNTVTATLSGGVRPEAAAVTTPTRPTTPPSSPSTSDDRSRREAKVVGSNGPSQVGCWPV